MLAYLLDENMSPVIAEQMKAKEPAMIVLSVHRWRGGEFVGQTDARVLLAATQEGLTLVTYDLKTIPDLLTELAAESVPHAGVLFVDGASIRSNDFSGLARALLAHWQKYQAEDWTNRMAFLIPAA